MRVGSAKRHPSWLMRWLLPPDEFFQKLRVPKLQFVPILVDDREGFPLEANLYVTERSLGEWAPGLKDGQDPVVPTHQCRRLEPPPEAGHRPGTAPLGL